MIALRRSGQFNSSSEAEPAFGQRSGIPKLITRFWNDPEAPADVTRLMAGWNECEPEFKIETFDDREAINYLRARCAPNVANAFHRAERASTARRYLPTRAAPTGG